ncbi:MAG TPA: serine/threonine-protein kinase [Gemmataceae bacterium]|nr:serine/threonine-protein kinase [Gemmataceae bacterium]
MHEMQGCPPSEQLSRLITAELADRERSVVETHVESCLACQQVLEELTAISYSQEKPNQSDTREKGIVPAPDFLDALLRQVPKTAGRGLRRFRPASTDGTSAVCEPDGAWPNLPDYEVVGVLGCGGMGVVYKARQRKLNRWVALKMLRGGKYAEPEQRARFQAEALAVAQLHHPNIVQIYEVGESEGLPYLVLELVEGGSLAQRVQDGPWAANQAAPFVETLARTVHFAHNQGIIHRDLKPANILLVSGGGVRGEPSKNPSADDPPRSTHHAPLTPKITDLGLAKQLDVDEKLTNTGTIVGTPSYMAPEQAEGRSKDVGPATDVHALGVILYELLTGRPPFQGASTLQTLEQVRQHEPVPPHRLQPGVPRDLETICLECLHKESQLRYASAQELADDLQRFQEGKPIWARPAGLVEQGWRWARRRPTLAALLLVIALIVLVGFPGVTWLWLQAEQERQAKEEQHLRADQEAQKALVQAYRGNLAAANASFNDHDVSDAAQYLRAASPALRSWEWQHLASRLDDSRAKLQFPEAEAIGLCLPENKIVAAANHQVKLWDALTGACLGTLTHDCSNRLAAIPTTKGSVLVVQNRDQTGWRLYSSPLALGTRGRELPVALDREPSVLAVDGDGTRMAVAWPGQTSDFYFSVLDLGDANRRLDFKVNTAEITALAFSPDGSRIASGLLSGAVRIWDLATGKPVALLQGHTQQISTMTFSPDGNRLLTGSFDGMVRQWDAQTGRCLDVRRGHKDRVLTVAYSPDGDWTASAGLDRTIRLWRSTEDSEPAVLLGHTDSVRQIAFSRDSRRLLSVAEDQTVRTWELVSRNEICCLRDHSDWINPVAFSPDGTLIASGGGDKTVRLWDAATGEALTVLPHTAWVSSLAFSPDGTWLVAGEWLGSIRIWDTATGQLQSAWTWKEKPPIIKGVAASPDGTRIVAGYYNWGKPVDTPQVRDRKTGRVVGVLAGQTEGVLGITYSPDGKHLATAGRDGTVRLWDAETYAQSAVWHAHSKEVNSVAYSADGRLLLSTGADNTIRLWNVATGQCRAILRGHAHNVYTAVFHPDGARIVSGGRDRFVRFWDPATGEEVARFPGHSSWVFSLAFSPDGTTLVSGSGDGTVRLWDTAPLARRLQARQQAQALRPEAERIVAHRFEEVHEPSLVVQTLRADPYLSDALRREALHVVLRRSMKESR